MPLSYYLVVYCMYCMYCMYYFAALSVLAFPELRRFERSGYREEDDQVKPDENPSPCLLCSPDFVRSICLPSRTGGVITSPRDENRRVRFELPYASIEPARSCGATCTEGGGDKEHGRRTSLILTYLASHKGAQNNISRPQKCDVHITNYVYEGIHRGSWSAILRRSTASAASREELCGRIRHHIYNISLRIRNA